MSTERQFEMPESALQAFALGSTWRLGGCGGSPLAGVPACDASQHRTRCIRGAGNPSHSSTHVLRAFVQGHANQVCDGTEGTRGSCAHVEGSRDNARAEAGSHGADSPLLAPLQEYVARGQLFGRTGPFRLPSAPSLILRSSKLLEVKKTSKLQSYQSGRPPQPLVTATRPAGPQTGQL